MCTRLLTKICLAASKALLLRSRESKLNLVRRRKVRRRQPRPVLNPPSLDVIPTGAKRSGGIPMRYLKAFVTGPFDFAQMTKALK